MRSIAPVHGAVAGPAPIRRVKPWRHSPEQCYRLRGWRRWLMWWLFGPVLIGGLLLAPSSDASAATTGGVLALLAGAMLAGWEWLSRRTRLDVTASGLRLHQVGCALDTPWRNVIGFHAQRGSEGFVLAEPLRTPGARRLAFFGGLAGLHDGTQADRIAECRFVPIEAFAWHLRKGTLVADVSALAPHLAEDLAAVNQALPMTPQQRRRSLALGSAIAALIVASAVLGWIQPAGMTRLVDTAYAMTTPLLVLPAGLACWQSLRARHWGTALLMAVWTLIALAWSLLAWQRVAATFQA